MYKQIKTQLEDKRLLEELIRGLEDRIKFKIQKQLGLSATSYAELKIECPTVEDKFVRVFSQIEKLDKDLQIAKEEYSIIEKCIGNIDKQMSSMDSVEKKIFRNRYILGLSVRQTAEKLHYSTDWVKEKTRKIFQK